MSLDDMLFGSKVVRSIEALPPLTIDLLPHQERAARFALSRSGSYLALDMGLGKTATAISVIAAAKSFGDSPALVVAPPSLLETWRKELVKFAPFLTVTVIRGLATRKLPPSDVYVIGYSTIDSWSDLPSEDPNTLVGKIKVLIVDEAHCVKNAGSKRTKGVTRLAKACDGYKVLLSGTPTPNGRSQEMGSQIEILGEEAWDAVGGKGRFYTHYCPIQRDDKGRPNRFGKRANNDLVGLNKEMSESFMIRMKKEDVLHLPAKGRTATYIESTGKPAKEYLLAEESLIAYLASKGRDWRGAARNEALVKLMTMRNLAGMCKIKGIVDRTKELLNEALPEGHGVFIVAEHHNVMSALMDGLHKYDALPFNGLLDAHQKEETIKAFNDGSCRVLIGQIKAVGVGLTLHGDGRNHHVLIAQLPWSPSDLVQAEDRLHRIGQENDVDVEICLASIEDSWTIDERLWGMLENKAFSSSELIDGRGEFLLEEIQDSIIDSYR